MDREDLMLNEKKKKKARQRQILNAITYMWNIKK